MTDENLIHCSAMLMLDFKDAARRGDRLLRDYVINLASDLKRRHEQRPARGYRDREPATGVFCAFDSGLALARRMRERGFDFPAGHHIEDARRDLCFQFKYAPGRALTSDPRGTRYSMQACDLNNGSARPMDFFQELRREVLSWRDPTGATLFDESSEIFLIGARPLPMIEMFAGLQPHDFLDAFPQSQLPPVQPQTGNLLFIQLQQENLPAWRAAGGTGRRRAMGGLFTSGVLVPGQSYALEFQNRSDEFDPLTNSVYIDHDLVDDPQGLGYICRIHDGFSQFKEDSPFRVVMRESFLPGIERPDIVSRYCPVRESEMAAIKFNSSLESIRLSRGGKTLAEVPIKTERVRPAGDAEGLIGDISFDTDLAKLTIRLPFLFFPDIELPESLLALCPIVEWVNEHRESARHTVSFWPQSEEPSHRAQCLRALAGRLRVEAEYLGSGHARAGMDNVLVYRDDIHLEAAARFIRGSTDIEKRADLTEPFNSVFTGRTPDTQDAITAFIDMMMKMLEAPAGATAGIAPFVASRYSFVFREPVISS